MWMSRLGKAQVQKKDIAEYKRRSLTLCQFITEV